MKFYNERKPMYLETDVSRIGLSAALLQTRDGMTCPRDKAPNNTILKTIAFACINLTITEWRYSSIRKEALCILDGLVRFHYYCFAREVSKITNHKPLVTIFKKDVATLSQRIQCILLRIYQFQVRIMYKPGPELFITDWLSRHNYMEDKATQIHCMDIKVDAIQTKTNILECISILQIQQATAQDDHLQTIEGNIIVGWPENKDQIPHDIRMYWSFRDDMAVINGIIMKGRQVIKPDILKTQALDQLHINHMGIENNNLNDDIGNYIKMCYMPYNSADTTKGQDNTSWHPSKTMGGKWHRHVYSQ